MLNDLRYPYQNNWAVKNGVAVIGHAFNQADFYQSTDELVSKFDQVYDELSFIELLNQLNGCFAVIIDKEDFRAAAVDIIRSYPILFRKTNSRLEFIGDVTTVRGKPNQEAIDIFKKCWCALDNDTLLEDVYQLSAGQYVFDNGDRIAPKYYYKHSISQKQIHLNTERASDIIDAVFRKYRILLKGKQIVVPLSGGYDSRLILTKLKEEGYKHILACTYGKEESHEVNIARKVCVELEVEWKFIQYDDSIFEEFFTDNWKSYSKNNHFFTSLPHEQDFFALNELKKRRLLEDRFVAIPGYCGDLLGGSITANLPESFDLIGLQKLILSKHFQGIQNNYKLLIDTAILSERDFYDTYQQWFVENKVSKFIVNSIRVFEHFGGTWVLPLWDKELIEYWYSIPYQARKKQEFYNKVLFEKYFKPNNIDFVKPSFDDNYPNQIKETIKKILPERIVRQVGNIKKSVANYDVNNLAKLNQLIKDDLKSTDYEDQINNTHAIYFLKQLNM